MKLEDLFINGKKLKLEGKTRAQLEHLRRLAQDEVRRYKKAIQNYPPERMERAGKPHLAKLERTIAVIDDAITKTV